MSLFYCYVETIMRILCRFRNLSRNFRGFFTTRVFNAPVGGDRVEILPVSDLLGLLGTNRVLQHFQAFPHCPRMTDGQTKRHMP